MPFRSEGSLLSKLGNVMTGYGPGSSPPNAQTMPPQQQASVGGVGGRTQPTAGMPGSMPPSMPPPQPTPAPMAGPKPSGQPGQSTTFAPKTAMIRPDFLIPGAANPLLGGMGVRAAVHGVDPNILRSVIQSKLSQSLAPQPKKQKEAEIEKVSKKRKSYGPGGRWIHDRAHRIMQEGDTPKNVAYAIATQQGHAVGKSPKGFRTPAGVARAKSKYDQPRGYRKTASDKEVRMLSPDYVESIGRKQQKVAPHILGGFLGTVGGAAGTGLGATLGRGSKPAMAAGALLGAGAGYVLGRRQWNQIAGGRDFGKAERRAALQAIRTAKAQGYKPVLVESRGEAEFDKVREILRNQKKKTAAVKAYMDEFLSIAGHAYDSGR